MSDFLQILINEESAKIHGYLNVQGQDRLRNFYNLADFARAVGDSGRELRPSHIKQIFDLMDLLQAQNVDFEPHTHWMLGTFALGAALEVGDDPEILNRVALDSVSLSLKSIDQKLSNPVVGGRDFFSFFAEHASVLSDEAFKAVWDNSVILTRYAGYEGSKHNLLFGSTGTFFQEQIPANRALTSLIAYYSYDHEAYFDWSDFGQGGVEAQRLTELHIQIQRAYAAGVRIVPHQADALLILGIAENLQGIRSMGDSSHSAMIDQTITALFEMVRLEGPQPITNNLLRSPGRQRCIKTERKDYKSNWLLGMFCGDFHSDLLSSLVRLRDQDLAPSVRACLDSFAGQILRSSAQAQAPLVKQSDFDNRGFISAVMEGFPHLLRSENPLQGLQKAERLAILGCVSDPETKRQLLKTYKSDRGHVLEHDLGM